MSIRHMCYLFSSFLIVVRTAFTSLTSLCFLESLDASLWICTILFPSRYFLLWIFSNVSYCDLLSSFNFSNSFSSSWLRFRRHWFSYFFSRTFPSTYSFDLASFLVLFNFLIFVTNNLLWFINWYIYSLLLVNVL